MSMQLHKIPTRLDLFFLPAVGRLRPSRSVKRRAASKSRTSVKSADRPEKHHADLRAAVIAAVAEFESWQDAIDSRYDFDADSRLPIVEANVMWAPYHREGDELRTRVVEAMKAFGVVTGQGRGFVDLMDGNRIVMLRGVSVDFFDVHANA